MHKILIILIINLFVFNSFAQNHRKDRYNTHIEAYKSIGSITFLTGTAFGLTGMAFLLSSKTVGTKHQKYLFEEPTRVDYEKKAYKRTAKGCLITSSILLSFSALSIIGMVLTKKEHNKLIISYNYVGLDYAF